MSLIDPISGKCYSDEVLKLVSDRNGLSLEFLHEGVKRGRFILLPDGSILRRGYTTGTCAVAASKAAVLLLLGKFSEKVQIKTQIGLEAELPVELIDKEKCIVGVRVDSGDYKEDSFSNVLICAKAKHSEKLLIKASEGIGVITKDGMGIKVGEKDIHPHILESIAKNLKDICTEVELDIFVPEGRAIGQKTGLAKLGVVDGIPIFGSSGFIEPYTHSYTHVIDFLVKDKKVQMGVSTGRTSKKFAVAMGFPEEDIIVAGNFILYALEKSEAAHKVVFGLPAKICDILNVDPRDDFDLKFESVGELITLLQPTQRSKLERFFNQLAVQLMKKTGADVFIFDYEGRVLGACPIDKNLMEKTPDASVVFGCQWRSKMS